MEQETVALFYTPLSTVDTETFRNGGEKFQTSDLQRLNRHHVTQLNNKPVMKEGKGGGRGKGGKGGGEEEEQEKTEGKPKHMLHTITIWTLFGVKKVTFTICMTMCFLTIC